MSSAPPRLMVQNSCAHSRQYPPTFFPRIRSRRFDSNGRKTNCNGETHGLRKDV